MKVYDIFQQDIYAGEIWQKSQCLDHEAQINQEIQQQLERQKFQATDHWRIWSNKDHDIVMCLVDDIQSCSQDYHSDLPYIFPRTTTVITDNHVTCPTQYRIIRVPVSFYGIYNYQPVEQIWQPQRLFSFSVNRIDYRRMHLLLDLAWRISLDLGHVNFNCVKRVDKTVSPVGIEQSAATFVEAWQQMPEALQQRFQSAYNRVLPLMPMKNYDLAFDLVPYCTWINILVESYSSDNNISVSEKMFRALVTPAPWTVYSGRYTVAWLESLGFDCMSDMIDHNHYDRLKEVEDKIRIFNWKSLEIAQHLQNLGADTVRARCQQASAHNQQLLNTMSQQWPGDFARWLETLPSQLAHKSTPW